MAKAVTQKVSELNSIIQELQSTVLKDQKQCVNNLLAFINTLGDQRLAPSEVLSPHVCSNVTILLMDNFVKPCLGNQRGKVSMARTDVTRPFRSIVEALHTFVAQDDPFPPLAWKQCRPLDFLLQHFADVLNSDTLVARCGQDYMALISFLLKFRVYAQNVQPLLVSTLTYRLLYLINDDATEVEEVAGLAEALSVLACTPHFVNCFGSQLNSVAVQLLNCITSRHNEDSVKTSMRGHTFLVRTLNILLRSAYAEHPEIEVTLMPAIRVLLSRWQAAVRRDGWRLEVISFVSLMLSLWITAGSSTTSHGRPVLHLDENQLRVLHRTIMPTVNSVLDTPRCEFGFGTDRELMHYPCEALQPVFDMGALALHAATMTAVQHLREGSQQTSMVREPKSEREGVQEAADVELACKRARLPLPQEDMRDKVRAMVSRRQVAPLWLHTLAIPFATQSLDVADVDTIVESLLELVGRGSVPVVGEQVVFAAISGLVHRASQRVQHLMWARFVPLGVAFNGVVTDDAAPSPVVYDILTVLISLRHSSKELQNPLTIPKNLLSHISPGFVRPQQFHAALGRFLVAASSLLGPALSQDQVMETLVGVLLCDPAPSDRSEILQIVVHLMIIFGESNWASMGTLHSCESDHPALSIKFPRSMIDVLSPKASSYLAHLCTKPETTCCSAGSHSHRGPSPLITAAVTDAVLKHLEAIHEDVTPTGLEGTVRLLHGLLLIAHYNVWSASADDEDQRLVGVFAGSSPDDIRTLTRSLSCFGAMAFLIGHLFSILDERLRRTQFSNTPEPIEVLAALLQSNACPILFSKPLLLWDPKQSLLRSLTHIARRLVQQSRALTQQEEPPGGALDTIASRSRAYSALLECSSIMVMRLRCAEISSSAIDPLIDVDLVAKETRETLATADLVGPAAAEQKPTTAAPRLLRHVHRIFAFLLRLGSPHGRSTAFELLDILWQRFRFSLLGGIFEMVHCVIGNVDVGLLSLDADAKIQLASCIEKWSAASLTGETGGQVVPPHLLVSMIGAASTVIRICQPQHVVKLVKWVAKRCSDASVQVRKVAAAAIAQAFTVIPNQSRLFREVLLQLKPMLMAPLEAVAQCSTAVATLVLVGGISAAVQPDVISVMLEYHATYNFMHKSLIQAGLRELATRTGIQGQNGVGRLLHYHLPRVLFDWLCVYKHRLDAFPFQCFGHDTLDAFVVDQAQLVLPFAIISRGISEVAAASGEEASSSGAAAVAKVFEVHHALPSTDDAALLRHHVVPISAICLGLSSTDNDALGEVRDGALLAWEFFKMQVGSHVCGDLVRKNVDQVLFTLLCITSASSSSILPLIDFSTATSALEKIAALLHHTRVGSIFSAHSGDRVFALLLSSFTDLVRNPARRHDKVEVLALAVTKWLDVATLTMSPVFKFVIHIACCIAKRFPEEQPTACSLIGEVWEILHGHSELLAKHRAFVSSVLLSFETVEARRTLEIVNRGSPALLQTNQNVSVLDWASQSQSIIELVAGHGSPGTDVEQQQRSSSSSSAISPSAHALQMLIKSVPVVAGGQAAQFFRNVAKALDHCDVSFLVPAASQGVISSDCHSANYDMLQTVASHLLNVASSPTHDIDVRSGAMGAFRAAATALLKISPHFEVQDGTVSRWDRHLVGCTHISEGAITALAMIVSDASNLIFSDDVVVMNTASKVLRIFVNMENPTSMKAVAILKEQYPEAAAVVAPFLREKIAAVRVSRPAAPISGFEEETATRYPSVTSDEFWIPLRECFSVQQEQQFVCRLTAALLSQVTSKADFLTVMAPLANCSFSLAAQLLPMVLLHVCCLRQVTGVLKFKQEFSDCLNKYLWARPDCHKVVTGAMLNAVNVMRLAHFTVLRCTGRKGPSRVRVVNTAHPAFEGIEPPATIRDTLWLAVPFDLIITACTACKEWHFALQLAEVMCEAVVPSSPGLTVLPSRRTRLFGAVGGSDRMAANKLVHVVASKTRAESHAAMKQVLAARSLLRSMLHQPQDRDVVEVIRNTGKFSWGSPSSPVSMSTSWESLLFQSDTHLRQDMPTGEAGQFFQNFSRALRNMGCQHSLLPTVRGFQSESQWSDSQRQQLADAAYEAAWRAAQWDDPAVLTESRDITSFNAAVFHGVRLLRSSDRSGIQKHISQGETAVLGQLSAQTALQSVARWQVLHDISSVARVRREGRSLSNCSLTQRPPLHFDGEMCSLLDVARLRILQCCSHRAEAVDHVLSAAPRLRVLGLPRVGLMMVNAIDGPPLGTSFADEVISPTRRADLLRIRAKLHMSLGELELGMQLLSQAEPELCTQRNAVALAKWAHTAKTAPTSQIITQLTAEIDSPAHFREHFLLGKLHDALCRDILSRVQSPDFRSKLRNLDSQVKLHKQTIDQYATHKTPTSSSAKALKHAEQKYRIAVREYNAFEQDYKHLTHEYLDNRTRAMTALASYLATSNGKHDTEAVFKLHRLWFEDVSDGRMEDDSLRDLLLQRVPTHKFLPIFPQLVVRLASHASLLFSLIKKIAIDHPFHTIWAILAMSNGDRFSAAETKLQFHRGKVDCARGLVQELGDIPQLQATISHLQLLSNAYLELAFQHRLPNDREAVKNQSTLQLPPGTALLQAHKWVKAPIPTIPLIVQPSGQYDISTLPTIAQFGGSCTYVGGINAPRVLHAMTTLGFEARQLLKSQDDLRQDAILEQIFCLCNTLMQKDEDASQRSLSMRTYMVVPLSPTSGLVQWVDNTLRLADYLVSKPDSAHDRYFPGQPRSPECRAQMESVARAAVPVKVQAYLEVCNAFTPAMHYFFLERFASAREWLAKRLVYTRSVAVSSMIGYVCGLGDRHISNILMDTVTAEVVHIDFGFAFEQGKLLPIPEIVPFRLTRDLVDGMGIDGTEGAFRIASEVSLRTLREEREMLHTVLQAFIHDPIAKWAVAVPDDAPEGAAPQHCKQSTGDADRAVETVRCKLAGYEGGEYLSVGGQVTMLIDSATDPNALACMFAGWQAWV